MKRQNYKNRLQSQKQKVIYSRTDKLMHKSGTTDRGTDKQSNRQTEEQTNRGTDKQTNRGTDKQRNRQTDRQTDVCKNDMLPCN